MTNSSAAPFNRGNMIYRNLGSTGMKVSLLSYGGWLTVGDAVKDDLAKELVKVSFEAGINSFDTAEIYSNGESEIQFGKAIKSLGSKCRRHRLSLALYKPRAGYDAKTELGHIHISVNRRELVVTTKLFFGTGRKDPNQNGLSRKHIIEGCIDSLARLQMDYVDVLMAHRFDVNTPVEETVRAFNYCIEKGWTHYWGTSEWSAAQIEEAIGIADRLGLIRPVADQPQYSMLHRERFEVEYADLYKKYGYGTTIWSPLASGVLTGKYNDGIPSDSRFATNEAFFKDTVAKLKTPEGLAKIDKVRQLTKVAERLGCTTGVLALAWAASNPNVSTVLLGATKVSQLEENLKALEVIPLLTPSVVEEIESILQNKPVHPPTYGR